MLLNPADYTYQYFNQPRGTDGLSGPIHIAYPLKDGFCTVLVKDHSIRDAINEYLGCNIGQKIGVNTPRAWLFKAKNSRAKVKIRFSQAVGIEYLDGFDDHNPGLYETEEKTIQMIKGKLLHIMMGEYDRKASLACFNGKIYAFDFAMGMYEESFGNGFLEFLKNVPAENGFTWYEKTILKHEVDSRRALVNLLEGSLQNGVPWKAISIAYSEVRDNMMRAYAENRFEDLVLEIEEVFSDSAGRYARALIDSTYNMIVDLPMREGEYYKTEDGVLLAKAPTEEEMKAMIKGRANAKK